MGSMCIVLFQNNTLIFWIVIQKVICSFWNRAICYYICDSRKIYFYDNGIRNAILQNFAPLALRNDVGALWENFFISERIKSNHYNARYCRSYFWRTTQQQEIDYIEESDGQFTLFEMKWNPNKASAKIPKAFMENYDVAETVVITADNYIDYL